MHGLEGVISNLPLLISGICIALILLETALRIFEQFDFIICGNKGALTFNVKYVTSRDSRNKLDGTIVKDIYLLKSRVERKATILDKNLNFAAIEGSNTRFKFQSDEKGWHRPLGL